NHPLKLVASAVYAARCTLKKTSAWTETLKHHTGYSEDQRKKSELVAAMQMVCPPIMEARRKERKWKQDKDEAMGKKSKFTIDRDCDISEKVSLVVWSMLVDHMLAGGKRSD
ncbi:G2/mitotic-specific cyclin S13-7-like protein, partial [Tanacetum coccineum]